MFQEIHQTKTGEYLRTPSEVQNSTSQSSQAFIMDYPAILRLLEPALLACMPFLDLNTIQAGMAKTAETMLLGYQTQMSMKG